VNRSKQLKIVIISNIASVHTTRWARYLSERGFDVTVVSSSAAESKIPGIRVAECLRKRSDSYFRNICRELIRVIAIRKMVKAMAPDVVHVHSLDSIHPLMMGVVGLICNGFPNLVVSSWGSDITTEQDEQLTWRGKVSKRLLLKQAKQITATSEFLAEATKNLAPKGKSVHVIPFGVDCSLFSPRRRLKESPSLSVGFVKHLSQKYGPDHLVRAMEIVSRSYPQSRLIVVGAGPMEIRLKEMARDLNIAEKVEFRGRVPHSSVPEILNEIDIFVMPSLYESFGVAAAEAQAMEIPVIASNVGGIPEVVMDGETGLLVKPRDVNGLAEAIVKLMANPTLRKGLGKKGREFVLSKYRWEDSAALMEQLYQNMCGA
jgi:glycosyltransferase involved in cell wall biosynthesis